MGQRCDANEARTCHDRTNMLNSRTPRVRRAWSRPTGEMKSASKADEVRTSEQQINQRRHERFFKEDNWAFNAGQFAVSVLALVCAVTALVISIGLTSWSTNVATEISDNERANARDQRCADTLIALRGSLSQLTDGYVLRPLDRDARLSDWTATKQSVDAATLACNEEIKSGADGTAYYSKLVSEFADEFSRAPSGEWSRCLSDRLHQFAGHFARHVMDSTSAPDDLAAFASAPTECVE